MFSPPLHSRTDRSLCSIALGLESIAAGAPGHATTLSRTIGLDYSGVLMVEERIADRSVILVHRLMSLRSMLVPFFCVSLLNVLLA
jgi:hypothetical protein